MGRPPCCDKSNVRRGLWTEEEDKKIVAYVSTHGAGNWASVPKKAGLKRCGKSCRLRWTNYLRPDLKHDDFTAAEEQTIISLHSKIGSRWSIIAHQLPGRTDNDVKNYWNTKLKKKLIQRGIDPVTHRPISHVVNSIQGLSRSPNGDLQTPSSTSPLFLPLADHPPSDLLAQIHAVNLVSQNLQNPAAASSSSSSLNVSHEILGDGSLEFSWMDGISASPLQVQGGESEGGDLGDSSLSDINSFVDSLLSRDDEMIWSFPEFLDENIFSPGI